jgi:hypothetical protein
MELELQFEGEGATAEAVEGIEDWLKNEQIPGLVIERKSQPTKPGAMGGIISLDVTGPIRDIGKSIFNYLGMRRPRLRVKMTIGGNVIDVDAENLKNQEAFLDRLITIAEKTGQ